MTKCARIHLHPKVFRGLVHSASIKFILHDKMQISSQNSSWRVRVTPQVEGFFYGKTAIIQPADFQQLKL